MSIQPHAQKSIDKLEHFLNPRQFHTLSNNAKFSEEKEFFIDKATELSSIVDKMPNSLEKGQDGLGDKAIVYLHYFIGGCDWYILEKDTTDEQYQAYGLADLGMGAEYGYIPIIELKDVNAELDFHFTPRTVGELKAEGKINLM